MEYWEANRTDLFDKKQRERCTPPSHILLKFNTDAANMGSHQWVLGVICRNSEGKVLKAVTRRVEAENSLAVAEYLAIKWALEVSLLWGFKRIIVETNCLSVLSDFQASNPLSPLFSIVEDGHGSSPGILGHGEFLALSSH